MRYLILLCLLLTTGISDAQEPVWTTYTNTNIVYDITQSGNYIWAATHGGILKVDKINRTTEVFNMENSGLTDNNSVVHITTDEAGNIWSATKGKIYKFDGIDWTVYDESNSAIRSINTYIRDILVDKNGVLWAASVDGLISFDGTDWKVYSTPEIGTYDITAVAESPDGSIWVGGVYGRLAKFDGVSWTQFNSSNSGYPDNKDIISLAVNDNGTVWIGCSGDLKSYDGNQFTKYSNENTDLGEGSNHDLQFDSSGNLWFANDGISMFDGLNFTNYHPVDSIYGHAPLINSFYMDDSDIMWLGVLAINNYTQGWKSPGLGLASYDGDNYSPIESAQSVLRVSKINDICNGPLSSVMIATESDGILQYDGSIWQHKLPAKFIDLIEFDTESNRIWTAENGSVSFYSGTEWFNIPLQVWGINSMVIDNQDIWFSTFYISQEFERPMNYYLKENGSGLNHYDGVTHTNFKIPDSGIQTEIIYDIVKEDKSQTESSPLSLWISTNLGILHYQHDVWTVYNTENSAILNNAHNKLFIDPRGYLWAGNSKGICMFDGLKFINFSSQDLSDVTSISMAEGGSLWIGTSTGLVRFDGKDFIKYNVGNSGLPDNRITVVHPQSSNKVWVGTEDGFASIDINDQPFNYTMEIYSSTSDIKIYPNPAGDYLVIERPEGFDLSGVRVYNSAGILQQVYLNGNTLDISSLLRGIYALRINSEQFYKFIKY